MDKLFTSKEYDRIREEGFGVEVDANGNMVHNNPEVFEENVILDTGLSQLKDTSGNSLIQVVTSLPATQISGIIYLVKES